MFFMITKERFKNERTARSHYSDPCKTDQTGSIFNITSLTIKNMIKPAFRLIILHHICFRGS